MARTIPTAALSGFLACVLVAAASYTSASARTARFPGNPVTAVKQLVPFPARRSGPCYLHNGAPAYRQSRGCPITLTLQRRFALQRQANPVCRCQNDPPSMSYRLVSATKRTAQVEASFHFRPVVRITFVLHHFSVGWLVADTFCTGRPKTSILRYLGPC